MMYYNSFWTVAVLFEQLINEPVTNYQKKRMGKGMKKVDLLYEGKAKKVYTTEDPDILIVDYKDCLLYTSDAADE